MVNRASEALQGDTASIKRAEAVDLTTNDADVDVTRGLYVGVTGNVVVIFAGNSTAVTLIGLAAGVWHPMQIQTVVKLGTTATDILAGY
jgi:hypothetical protein